MRQQSGAFLLLLFGLSCFALLPGCRKGAQQPEGLLVPRLMMEASGANYGAIINQGVTLPVSGSKIALSKEPLVGEFDIINAEMVKVDMGMALLLQTSELGGRALYRGSVNNMGSRIVLTINGNPIGARRIDGPIKGGNYFTFVELDDQSLGELVLQLKESIAYLQSQK